MFTLKWIDDARAVEMVDQTLLPGKLKLIRIKTYERMAKAIEVMEVRGAPAIGVAAAMGMALAAYEFRGDDAEKFAAHIKKAKDRLAATRPTAVNLF